MRHTYECSVRFDDLDAFGHVNNVTFAEYLQEARVDFAYRHLAYGDAPHQGSVVVHQSIDYLAPVPFRSEPLQVHVWVTRIGTSSFDLAYEVSDATTLFARATGSLVAYDVSAGSPRPISDDERATLERFVEEAA
ncbi:acyl-CoA thioester hydrolase [Haloactinopolyspora alba]|uniref:Acyl-CoA thioester hydrolase n=1 Tax=Haloactinopolyspora alba TaxID=648780 RepID=A0A2P8DHF1_9ACTN|nr:thioesterase family protein [Haloactinopolyspora alba]PSK96641.1 acyl-CoA thioester hydrolase [Haloactinopolyspora alba]